MGVVRLAVLACCGAFVLCAGALAGTSLGPSTGEAGPAAFCTKAQKRAAQKALAVFKKSMAARRRAYFKRVRNPKKRKAFVKAQQATLKRLTAKAGCRVRTTTTRPTTTTTRTTTTSPSTTTTTTTTTTPPPQSANLIVSMTPPAATTQLHATASFTIEVANHGTVAADNVVLTDALPAGLRRVAAGQCEGITTITCALGTIQPTGSRTVRLTLRPLELGALAHQPTATSTSGDANPADNAVLGSVTATPLPTYTTPPSTGFSVQLARPGIANDPTFDEPWVGEWPKSSGEFLPATGTLHGAVVFVDFPDRPGSASVGMDETLALLETDARAWYAEASHGRFTLDLDSAGGWYRMSKNVGDYGIGVCCSQANLKAFVQEAIANADASYDFSTADAVWVIGPSTAWEQMTIMIGQRKPGAGITADGRELRRWIAAPARVPSVPTQIEPARFAAWEVTHEVGHFLGLPDLYYKPPGCPACANTFEWVGWWDLMSDVPTHAHFLAWHKWLLGWLDPAQLRALSAPGSVTETLTPLAATGGLKAVVVPLTADTAYVVEARSPLGWESGLCDRGVLLYTVDSTKLNAEGPVHVVPAHGVSTPTTCGPIGDATFDVGAGEVSTHEDASIKMEVLEALVDGSYRVRVTRK